VTQDRETEMTAHCRTRNDDDRRRAIGLTDDCWLDKNLYDWTPVYKIQANVNISWHNV